ncbi:2Fe-2S iron-sulfur cluster-binding protein [Microbacterium sp. NPDC055903]
MSRQPLAEVADVPLQGDGALLRDVDGVEVGLYRVGEEIVAWRNICPHEAAPVCRGRVAGTRLESLVYEYRYGRHQEILRCPWHGWEFDLSTGEHLSPGSSARLRKHPVDVIDDEIYARNATAQGSAIELTVSGRRQVARDVIELTLAPVDPRELPAWAPGSHAELRLPSGLVRHYSLCGSPSERGAYTIAVQHERDGRGGSAEIHDAVGVGTGVELLAVRNRFPLVYAPSYRLIAGGIGITPLLPIARLLARRGTPFTLLHLVRDRATQGYHDEVERLGGVVMETSTQGRPDLEAFLYSAAPGTAVYCCGPTGLVERVSAAADAAGLAFHSEVFTPPQARADHFADPEAFDLVLGRSGERIHVPAESSALDALRDAGHPAASSCEEGWCGSCEVGVREGSVLHRDRVLTDAERDAGTSMMLCVSRAETEVVIDL